MVLHDEIVSTLEQSSIINTIAMRLGPSFFFLARGCVNIEKDIWPVLGNAFEEDWLHLTI